jgi:O-antigen/teichoic acid export membrane protein
VADSSGNIRIAKNTVALYIRMGITMLISFFTVRITLDVLGVEDYGLNNVVASIVTMFGFINGSMGTSVQRFISIEIGKKNEQALSKVFSTGLYLHVVVALITLVIAEIFAFFFLSKLNIPSDRLFAAHFVFQVSIFTLILHVLNVPFSALLRAREQFTIIAVLDIIKSVFQLGVLYLLYNIEYDKLVVLSTLNFGLSMLYIGSITFIACKFKEVSFRLVVELSYLTKMLKFMSMLVLTVLASVINNNGIIILVNLFFGLTINAAYAIAFQVSTVMNTFAMNFKQSVVPQLMAAFGANDRVRMNKLIFLGTKITFLLMLLITIPVIFESNYILSLWLKEPPQHAAALTSLILISLNINTFSYFVYQAVLASGDINRQQILTSISYVVSIAIIYLAYKIGGNFLYAIYIPLFFSFIRNLIILYSARKAIDLDIKYYVVHVVGRSMLLVGVLCFLIYAFREMIDVPFFRLTITLLISFLFVTIGGYYFLLNKSERTTINNMLNIFTINTYNRIINLHF